MSSGKNRELTNTALYESRQTEPACYLEAFSSHLKGSRSLSRGYIGEKHVFKYQIASQLGHEGLKPPQN